MHIGGAEPRHAKSLWPRHAAMPSARAADAFICNGLTCLAAYPRLPYCYIFDALQKVRAHASGRSDALGQAQPAAGVSVATRISATHDGATVARARLLGSTAHFVCDRRSGASCFSGARLLTTRGDRSEHHKVLMCLCCGSRWRTMPRVSVVLKSHAAADAGTADALCTPRDSRA